MPIPLTIKVFWDFFFPWFTYSSFFFFFFQFSTKYRIMKKLHTAHLIICSCLEILFFLKSAILLLFNHIFLLQSISECSRLHLLNSKATVKMSGGYWELHIFHKKKKIYIYIHSYILYTSKSLKFYRKDKQHHRFKPHYAIV